MEAIILLGGPGAGKGTLADFLKRETAYIHVSTGDMLRAAIQAGTPVGVEAKRYMDEGRLVPDSVILKIIAERVAAEAETSAFMFDGFPRTIEQAEGLDELFNQISGQICHVFNLTVPADILMRRLTGRRICRACAAVYHLVSRPPHAEGICDACGGELYQRSDDSEETIRNRLEVYQKQTAPLIAYYSDKGLLREIEAGGTPAATDALVAAVLNG